MHKSAGSIRQNRWYLLGMNEARAGELRQQPDRFGIVEQADRRRKRIGNRRARRFDRYQLTPEPVAAGPRVV